MIVAIALAQLVLVILTPTFFCAGFYFGYNTAENVYMNQGVSTENIPGKKLFDSTKQAVKTRTHKETDEERLARILAENVENYGTNVPQKEVV